MLALLVCFNEDFEQLFSDSDWLSFVTYHLRALGGLLI
jgi:hypothetical protein